MGATQLILEKPGRVWSTADLAQALWQADDAAAIKKTER